MWLLKLSGRAPGRLEDMRKMMKHIAVLIVVLAALVSLPVVGFDGKLAADKSSALTQRELDQAWDHFEAASAAASRGSSREALRRLRQGLIAYPAEISAHLLAARLAESEGQFGVAVSHWTAIAALASSGSSESDLAIGAMKRLIPKQESGQTIRCAVFGQIVNAHLTQCDDTSGVNQVAVATNPNTERSTSTAITSAGYIKVQAFVGPIRPENQVATVFGMDASPNWGSTYICRIDGKSLPAPASVVYVLPGNYRLGWCYKGRGQEAQGETDIRVQSGSLYQINASSLGNGRWSQMFIQMPLNRKLTWRNIAPGVARPDIDELVPYGPN